MCIFLLDNPIFLHNNLIFLRDNLIFCIIVSYFYIIIRDYNKPIVKSQGLGPLVAFSLLNWYGFGPCIKTRMC